LKGPLPSIRDDEEQEKKEKVGWSSTHIRKSIRRKIEKEKKLLPGMAIEEMHPIRRKKKRGNQRLSLAQRAREKKREKTYALPFAGEGVLFGLKKRERFFYSAGD